MDTKIVPKHPPSTQASASNLPRKNSSTVKRKNAETHVDFTSEEKQTSSAKFRKIAENAKLKIEPRLAPPTEPAKAEKELILPPSLNFRYASLKTIKELLPDTSPETKIILRLAEKAFDAGIPYFLAKQKNTNPISAKDASTLFAHLFEEQDTFYDVESPDYIHWKNYVDHQEFILFSGTNTNLISVGSVYNMLDDGLNIALVRLLVTAANPTEGGRQNESKELISFLYKINYLPNGAAPNHIDIFQGLSESERETARVYLAVHLASVDGSPMFVKLLAEGVSVNKRDKHTGIQALTSAIVNNAQKNVSLLLEQYPDLDIDIDYLNNDELITVENRDLVMWARSAFKDKAPNNLLKV